MLLSVLQQEQPQAVRLAHRWLAVFVQWAAVYLALWEHSLVLVLVPPQVR